MCHYEYAVRRARRFEQAQALSMRAACARRIFVERRKATWSMVHVEPHANSISRNEKINIAILIKFGLRIARSWRQRAQNYGCAATLAPDQFGNRVNAVA